MKPFDAIVEFYKRLTAPKIVQPEACFRCGWLFQRGACSNDVCDLSPLCPTPSPAVSRGPIHDQIQKLTGGS